MPPRGFLIFWLDKIRRAFRHTSCARQFRRKPNRTVETGFWLFSITFLEPAAQICTSLFWRPKSHCRNRIFEYFASRFWYPLHRFVHGPVSGRLNRAVAPRFWKWVFHFGTRYTDLYTRYTDLYTDHISGQLNRAVAPWVGEMLVPKSVPAQIRSPTRRLEATKSITNLKGHRNSPHTSQFRTTSPIGVSSLKSSQNCCFLENIQNLHFRL